MRETKYEGNTATFLLAMVNLNIKVQLSGISWRMEIEGKMPLEILKRLSMEEYDLDSEWITALETVGTHYEDFLLDRKLTDRELPREKPMKRKSSDEERRPEKKKRKTYTKAEKEAYKASKQSGKGKKAQGAGKTSEWDQMYKGIPENLISN